MFCLKQEGEISEVQRTAASHADMFDTAYRSLREDGATQFNLPTTRPTAEPPAWIEAVGRFVRRLFEPVGRFFAWIDGFLPEAGLARILLWGLIGVALVAFAVMLVQRVRNGQWRWPSRAKPASNPVGEDEWRPEAAPVRAWLAEADALAGEGHYAAAIHCLLLRSIEDLAHRRPQLARPSFTGRELSRTPLLPARAQTLFASIAAIVERSLFGGRKVAEGEWIDARQTYSEFAHAGTWRR
jgi:hypothetical protein